jgi:hypothetical protein
VSLLWVLSAVSTASPEQCRMALQTLANVPLGFLVPTERLMYVLTHRTEVALRCQLVARFCCKVAAEKL